VHVEHTAIPGFGHAEIRDLITSVTGLAADLPKTTTTGCGKRRPLAMCSKEPDKVTCLACRHWAAEEHAEWARLARDLARYMAEDPAAFAGAKATPEQLADQAAEHESLAAAYRRL
jgi:hypothetical protein